MCIGNSKCYDYIVKSEWLNLRSLVTDTAFLPALEYLYHSILLEIAHTG